jgi:hypothetical protein
MATKSLYLHFAQEDAEWGRSLLNFDWSGTRFGYANIRAFGFGHTSPIAIDVHESPGACLAILSQSSIKRPDILEEFSIELANKPHRPLFVVPVIIDNEAKVWWEKVKNTTKLPAFVHHSVDFSDSTDAATTRMISALAHQIAEEYTQREKSAAAHPIDTMLDLSVGGDLKTELATFSTPKNAPKFFFVLDGEGARGTQVILGSEFDLVFNYEELPLDALAEIYGERLEKLLKLETAGIEITILPQGGLRLKNDRAGFGRANFAKGRLSQPVRFTLTAPPEAPDTDAGIHISLSLNGLRLRAFFLDIHLVKELDLTALPEVSRINLDALELADGKVQAADQAVVENYQEPRKHVQLLLVNDHDTWYATFSDFSLQDGGRYPPWIIRNLPLNSLCALLETLQPRLSAVANHVIWTKIANDLTISASDANTKAIRECLKKVMAAGFSLYNGLQKDPDFRLVLETIDALPNGSKVTILTNSAFLPWEILYPIQFDDQYEGSLFEEKFHPSRLWGYRFEIECSLQKAGSSGRPWHLELPPSRRQPPELLVSMILNPKLGQESPLHQQYAASQGDRARYTDNVDEIKELFNEPGYPATLLYIFCHGQSLAPFQANHAEMLDFGTFTMEPTYLLPNEYTHWPVVFINSCCSAAVSPLALYSFLETFLSRKAFGLIAASFPVPIPFAAAFGKIFLENYMAGKPVGRTLLELRRNLLKREIPLGLFYSLQCPLDVCAPS